MESLKHVGLIPDGTRRWARKNKKTYSEGCFQVMNHLDEIIDLIFKNGVQIISLYGLSTENLGRKNEELLSVYNAAAYAFNELFPPLFEKWCCSVEIAGNIALIPDDIQKSLTRMVEKTQQYSKRKLYILLAYNPWDEILHAVQKKDDKEELQNSLWVKEPIDLVIRTGGGQLLSNFLPLQCGYAELFFFEELFNDLKLEDLSIVLRNFPRNGKRLFGK